MIMKTHEELLDKYWVPSDQEPFAEYWVRPELLTPEIFETHQYHMANVSCPFFYNGVRYVPKILEVAESTIVISVESGKLRMDKAAVSSSAEDKLTATTK